MTPRWIGVRAAGALAACGVLLPACATAAGGHPEPPRLYVDTTPVSATGRTIAVGAGGNVQAALDRAQPGDVITLEAGASFAGPFTLPKKHGEGWVTVRTSAPDRELPAPGVRIDPSYARVMPKLEAARGTVIVTASGAHHYRFVGIEIRPKAGVALVNLVQLGTGEPVVESIPSHFIFERCYLHGDPEKGTRRGIALNSRTSAVIDSYLSDFKHATVDTQAIGGWTGPGPFKIVNNYLEASGENVMFGGADPAVPRLVPSDIEIRNNRFSKPLAWKIGEPEFRGPAWAVKNLFELKNARRVLVEGNVFERNWAQAQSGFAVQLTVRNEEGRAPWSVVEDVLFVSNVVREVGAGINVLGRDGNHPSEQTRRLRIANNLFEDVGGPRWTGPGTFVQILEGTAHVTIEHNTVLQRGPIIFAEGTPHTGFIFRDNIVAHNTAGIAGTGTGTGTSTLDTFFPGAVVRRNVIVGGPAPRYPPDNFFPASLAEVGFADPGAGRYRVSARSRHRQAATDGRDPGADFEALDAALAGRSTFHTPSTTRPADPLPQARPAARRPGEDR
jgi:hypothetical protein